MSLKENIMVEKRHAHITFRSAFEHIDDMEVVCPHTYNVTQLHGLVQLHHVRLIEHARGRNFILMAGGHLLQDGSVTIGELLQRQRRERVA
jgi:hypothetical protein